MGSFFPIIPGIEANPTVPVKQWPSTPSPINDGQTVEELEQDFDNLVTECLPALMAKTRKVVLGCNAEGRRGEQLRVILIKGIFKKY